MARFDGKTVLVTGGTTGIGFTTAKLFQQEGARIAITGQDQTRLDEAVKELIDVLAIRVDIRSLSDIEAMVSKVKTQFGSIDVLFINAGIAKFNLLNEVDEVFIDQQFDINFKGAFFTIQKLAPIIRDQGSIVLNTSIVNQQGSPGTSIYAATKAALRSLTRTLSAEFIERGIRVNAVSPGPINTPIYQKLGLPPENLQQIVQQLQNTIPMHRFGEPEEIAKAVLFLASDDASFVLGQELAVDGGLTAL